MTIIGDICKNIDFYKYVKIIHFLPYWHVTFTGKVSANSTMRTEICEFHVYRYYAHGFSCAL